MAFNLGNDLPNLLREAQELHHKSEKELPPHDWVEWYSVYIWNRSHNYTAQWSARVADRAVLDILKEQE